MKTFTVVAADAGPLNIGNVSGQAVGRKVLHVTRTSGTFTPTHRVTGSGRAGINCPYYDRAAPTTLVAAGTAVSATSVIEVDSSGVDILLTLASFVGTIDVIDLEG